MSEEIELQEVIELGQQIVALRDALRVSSLAYLGMVHGHKHLPQSLEELVQRSQIERCDEAAGLVREVSE